MDDVYLPGEIIGVSPVNYSGSDSEMVKKISSFFRFSYIEKFRELSQKLYRSKCRRFGGKSPPIAVLQEIMTLNKPPSRFIYLFS